MKLLVYLTVTVLTVANTSLHAWPDPTRGGSGVNLNGRMFTLSSYNGGVVFYSPYRPPPWATPTPYQTSGYTSRYSTTGSNTQTNTALTDTSTESYSSTHPTTPRTTHSTTRRTTHLTTPYTTTAPPTRGVSVCLRYITGTQSNKIFTLSPSSSRLSLNINGPLIYQLSLNYQSMYLLPNIKIWPDMKSNIWTNICITLDTVKGVAQMFRDSEMSSRKLINNQFVWSGEAVVDFTGFEGQVTDVQVWDYPLRYKEVLYYMSSGFYGYEPGC
ncbi:PREDICTED: uncharacterized protein LOC107081081, partial [Cyprinodon variegatus]|uniref:uncharacterized protein LOC107081081 n=1 Tax=Cyprinodon variegatus TaxID=28743 RepID=UPI000742763F